MLEKQLNLDLPISNLIKEMYKNLSRQMDLEILTIALLYNAD